MHVLCNRRYVTYDTAPISGAAPPRRGARSSRIGRRPASQLARAAHRGYSCRERRMPVSQ